jgi:hypothetical protein
MWQKAAEGRTRRLRAAEIFGRQDAVVGRRRHKTQDGKRQKKQTAANAALRQEMTDNRWRQKVEDRRKLESRRK